jgi:membrane protein implicated in regulation of membrane protease activity
MLRFSRTRPVEILGPRGRPDESGSAVVEFIMVGVVLLVPVLYFVVTVGTLQAASFAAVGAADHAAKAFVSSPDVQSAERAAQAAGRVAAADFGIETGRVTVSVECDRSDCLEAGTAVTVTVEVEVPLPLAPSRGAGGLTAGRAVSSATQFAGRFR